MENVENKENKWKTMENMENGGKHGKRETDEKDVNLDICEIDIFDHFTKVFQLKYSNFCISKDCTACK